MPTLVLDEARIAPQTLGRNDEAHAVIRRRYALDEHGDPVSGLSPSGTPGPGADGGPALAVRLSGLCGVTKGERSKLAFDPGGIHVFDAAGWALQPELR